MRPRLALVAAAAGFVTTLATAVLATPTAHAETWSRADATRDVTAVTVTRGEGLDDDELDTEKAPGDRITDIRRIRVEHTPDLVTISLRIRNVTPGNQVVQFGLRGPGQTFGSGMVMRAGGRERLQAVTYIEDGPKRCRNATAQIRPKQDTVTFTMPTSCLDNPAWVRVTALYGTFTGRPTKADTIRFDDALSRTFDPMSIGAWSPKVHVG